MATLDVPTDVNIVRNRFVLAIKDPGTAIEKLKSLCIVQGHQGKQKHVMSHNAPILIRFSLRLIVAMSVIYFDCDLFTRDIEYAYIQSKSLSRPVYTYAPPRQIYQMGTCEVSIHRIRDWSNLDNVVLIPITLPTLGIYKSYVQHLTLVYCSL